MANKSTVQSSLTLDTNAQNCAVCKEKDTLEMISCDDCKKWYHFHHVNMDSDAVGALDMWYCQYCEKTQELQREQAQVERERLELEKEKALRQIELEKAREEVKLAKEQASMRNEQLERDVQAKRDEVARVREELAKMDQELTQCRNLATSFHSQVHHDNQSTPNSSHAIQRGERNTEGGVDTPDQGQPTVPEITSGTSLSQSEPLVTHFLARQWMRGDLPSFSGKPEEWPTFYAMYEQSSKACNFSNVENLIRLQKALTGDARRLIESQLTDPANTPSILTTLKMVYGRPALVIRAQIDRIKKSSQPRANDLASLVFFAAQVRNLIAAIESAIHDGVYDDRAFLYDHQLMQELIEMLPVQNQLGWGMHSASIDRKEVHLKSFSMWLDRIAEGACSVLSTIPCTKSIVKSKEKEVKRINLHDEESETEPRDGRKCKVCEKDCSKVSDCKKFQSKTYDDKWKVVKELKLCRMCLKRHKKPKCDEAKKCEIDSCQSIHHRLLHKPKQPSSSQPNVASTSNTQATLLHSNSSSSDVLFRIIPVTLRTDSIEVNTFAFLDDGSSATLMDQNLADKLQLKGEPKPLCLKWTDGRQRKEMNSCIVKLQISGRNDDSFYDFKARTVAELNLPSQTVDVKTLQKRYQHLKKLNFKSYTDKRPLILIGLDNWHLCSATQVKEGKTYEPIATKTKLGWDVCGALSTASEYSEQHLHVHVCGCEPDDTSNLEKTVRQFFVIDNMGVSYKREHTLTDLEKRAEKMMEMTTVKKGTNYQVGLLWKFDKIELPNSYNMAYRRLLCLEKSLLADPLSLSAFRSQIAQLLEKGFIRELLPQELNEEYPRVWYLPIFTIKNPNKPGKLRLVWDAAAAVDGISLNHVLLKGLDLMSPLLDILLRFRQKNVAMTADIREMFHMVRVDPQDQQAQRFLWRDCNRNERPRTFVVNVMTFGATCSPYQAQFVMRKNASQFALEYPEPVKTIKDDTYVDDYLQSSDDEEHAIKLAKCVKSIHANAGFELRNWKSNSRKLEAELNESTPTETQVPVSAPEENLEKVLGMFWNTASDCIAFSLKFNKGNKEVLEGTRVPTKREILIVLMSLFDPLGLLAQFISGLRIIMRHTWLIKLNWDEEIPQELNKQWKIWLEHLKLIEKLEVPRCYLQGDVKWGECVASLHTFVDAGEAAHCAVVYLRIETPCGVKMSLVTAKSKTNPLKYTPIPRLELLGALLGARLTNTVLKSLTVPIKSAHFWTDSTAALHWLNSSKKLTIWVAFRVGEIKEITNINNWHYVPTAINVADLGTKWHSKFDLQYDNEWYQGPQFLHENESQWPKIERAKIDDAGSNLEEFEDNVIATHVDTQQNLFDQEHLNNFSQWKRLLRSAAYVERFSKRLKSLAKGKAPPIGPLTANELSRAEMLLLQDAQNYEYGNEISLLSEGKRIPKTSTLYNLCPFLDENRLIRLKGRIEAASYVGTDMKYPIILPKASRITRLIVHDIHERCKHQFTETVVCEVRRRFHVSNLRTLVKEVQRNCQECRNRKAKPSVPIMAPLPEARLAHGAAPFTHTGADLFGPLTVVIRRKPEKRWGVLFTCMTSRAVHIEQVASLSTDSFILAFRNFCNRRGTPHQMYCDQGTNFIGAEREIREAYRELDFNQVMEKTESPSFHWNFNPPSSPHFGGAWERLIRSIKSALKVMFPTHRYPSPEVLESALIEIEFILNSRPLTYIALDDPQAEPLTPNHILMANRNHPHVFGKPPPENAAVKKQWRLSQQAAQRFWKRWLHEYLPTITRRTKWQHENGEDLDVGDVVVVVEDETRSFPKGRIIEVNRSRDKKVRSAVVQTFKGIYTRPTAKIAKLDVKDPVSSRPPV